jgi:hypothetical protein
VTRVTYLRAISLALLVVFFESCSVAEQTPDEVGRNFEEGIKGNGKIVPIDQGGSEQSPSSNSPITQPASSSH